LHSECRAGRDVFSRELLRFVRGRPENAHRVHQRAGAAKGLRAIALEQRYAREKMPQGSEPSSAPIEPEDPPTAVPHTPHTGQSQGQTLPSAVAQGVRPAPPAAYPQAVPIAVSDAWATLAGEVLEHSPPQRIRVRFPVQRAFLNAYGALQGGFLTAMLDSVIAMCAQAVDSRRQSATLEISVRYFRSIRSGHVVVDGAVLRAGQTTVTIECMAWDDAGQMCAKAIATNLFTG
jgi:uncharacterized protein (TIGR00369 family)